MAWPMGYNSEAAKVVAREYFATARTIAGNTRESWPPADPLRLRAITGISSYAGGYSIASVKAAIDRVAAEGGWLLLVFHRITDTPASTMDCSHADLEAILDHLTATPTVAVRTVRDAVSTTY